MTFVITQYLDIWFVRSDILQLLTNCKILMLSSVNICKVVTFLMWQKQWKTVIEYVNTTDLNRRTNADEENKGIIKKVTKYCRTVTYLYWFLTYTTGLSVVLQPVFKYVASPTYRYNVRNGSEVYIQVVNSWTPFDKNVMPGYIFASLLQTYCSVIATGWVTAYDTIVIVLMVFFKGELELLRRDCRNIFGSERSVVSEAEAVARIKKCHSVHVDFVKHARLLNSCLLPIMLLYVIVCSIMLCATLYQITLSYLKIETSPMQRFLITQYLVFGVFQLFMYCWHSNDVYYMSQTLLVGAYESTWWNGNVSRQRDIIILTHQFSKTIVFTAGPFSDITVATFINIIKGAYSYYTLLTQSQA